MVASDVAVYAPGPAELVAKRAFIPSLCSSLGQELNQFCNAVFLSPSSDIWLQFSSSWGINGGGRGVVGER